MSSFKKGISTEFASTAQPVGAVTEQRVVQMWEGFLSLQEWWVVQCWIQFDS